MRSSVDPLPLVADRTKEWNPGRVSGLWYLAVIVFGAFAEITRSTLVVPGNPQLTVANVLGSEWLFRTAFVSDLVMMVCFVVLGLSLRQWLRPFGPLWADAMVAFVATGAAINMNNLGNHFAVLSWLQQQQPLVALTAEQQFRSTYEIANLLFGLWLFPLGVLLVRSRLVPVAVGLLSGLASLAYLASVLTHFLVPEALAWVGPVTAVPEVVGEFGITIWLLARGSRR